MPRGDNQAMQMVGQDGNIDQSSHVCLHTLQTAKSRAFNDQHSVCFTLLLHLHMHKSQEKEIGK